MYKGMSVEKKNNPAYRRWGYFILITIKFKKMKDGYYYI